MTYSLMAINAGDSVYNCCYYNGQSIATPPLLAMTMRWVMLLFFTITWQHISYAASPKKLNIVTSTVHIATLVKQIAGDEAIVDIIANQSSCPHHYHLKPSDIAKVKAADLIIFINDKFENFMPALLEHSLAPRIRLSELAAMRLIEGNWHIWLDLGNAELISQAVAGKLAEILPDKQAEFMARFAKVQSELRQQLEARKTLFKTIPKVLLLDDSLAYLFMDVPHEADYIQESGISLKQIVRLKSLRAAQCLLISDNAGHREALAKSLGRKVIALPSEHWDPTASFLANYQNLLNQLKHCHN